MRTYRHKWLIILFWVLVWQGVSSFINQSLLFPGPLQSLTALFFLMRTSTFWLSIFYTMIRVLIGFALALFTGTSMGILCAVNPILDRFLSPLRGLIRSTPVSSFIILVLLWLSQDITPVFISFLMVLPVIWINIQESFLAVDPTLIEMAGHYGFSTPEKIEKLYFLSMKPSIYSACATGLGFAWKSAIAAEVIARPVFSVGRNLQDAKVYLQTEQLFAWTLSVIILSQIFDYILNKSIKKGQKS